MVQEILKTNFYKNKKIILANRLKSVGFVGKWGKLGKVERIFLPELAHLLLPILETDQL
jgi:hypothetical protein